MIKYMAIVEYDGAAYHGWQLQKDVPTVQGTLEIALERVVRSPTRVHAAGRTDAGVHAVGQVVHFSVSWNHSRADLLRACNALLPPDVAVRGLCEAPVEFHARHSARTKTYVYTILNRDLRRPLERLYSWHAPQILDEQSMRTASEFLVGTHDFAAFGLPTDGTPSTVRQILVADVERRQDGFLKFSIQGTGFLRYMVRSIVGTLALVGKNKMTPLEFNAVLESGQRSRSGPAAPPHGLRLESVEYGPEIDALLKKLRSG